MFEAWEQTRAVAEALQATVCIFQTSSSFNFSKENETNMRRFFGEIDRGTLELGWEHRGDWQDHPNQIRDLCDDLNLIHVVDLLRQEPVSTHPVAYPRLHGLTDYPYDYNYDYSMEELQSLAHRLRDLSESQRKVYCLFNNFHMYKTPDNCGKSSEPSIRLCRILRDPRFYDAQLLLSDLCSQPLSRQPIPSVLDLLPIFKFFVLFVVFCFSVVGGPAPSASPGAIGSSSEYSPE